MLQNIDSCIISQIYSRMNIIFLTTYEPKLGEGDTL